MINKNDTNMTTYSEKLETYKNQVKMYDGILISHNWVVKVGAYTVGLDSENKTQLELVDFPSQFTESGVNQILNECKFSNRNGDVNPEVILAKDWYSQQIKSLELIVASGI